MYSKSFLSTVALFFLVSSANAAPRESRGPHQILARSSHLSLRQTDGAYGACTSICQPAEDKAVACGNSVACACAPSVFVPFQDCAKCAYNLATDASLKAEMVAAYNEYVDGCKDTGHPVTGDTGITGSAQPSASVSSSAAAASVTASSSTTSNKSASNGAIGLSASFVSSVALPAAALAVSGLLF